MPEIPLSVFFEIQLCTDGHLRKTIQSLMLELKKQTNKQNKQTEKKQPTMPITDRQSKR